MQKEHNNIDDLFKSELLGLKTTAPEFVKKQIDKSLFGKNKLFLMFLITIFISLFLFSNNRNTDLAVVKNSIPNKIKNNLKTKNAHQSINFNLQNNPINSKALNSEYSITKENSSPPTPLKQTISTVSKPFSTTIRSSTASANHRSSDFIKNNSITTHSPHAQSQIENEVAKINTQNISKPTHNIESIIGTENKEARLNSILGIEPTRSSNTQEKIELNNNTTIPKETTSITQSYKQKKIQPLELNKPENNQEQDASEVTESSEVVTQANEYEFKNKLDSTLTDKAQNVEKYNDITALQKQSNSSLLLSWTSGLNLSKSTYSAVNTIDANYYQTNNNENINFEHNILVNLLLQNNVLIGSGIGISRQGYDYTYYEESISDFVTIDSSYSISSYIYANIDTLQEFEPIDSVYQLVYDTLTETSQLLFEGTSQARYVHIPFQLGYVYKSDKFMIGVQALMRFNILYNSSGQLFENNVVNSFTKTNSIFKKSYFDFAIKADLYYNVFDKFYVNGSVKYSPQLNNTYQNTSIERKTEHFHIGLGLSYKF